MCGAWGRMYMMYMLIMLCPTRTVFVPFCPIFGKESPVYDVFHGYFFQDEQSLLRIPASLLRHDEMSGEKVPESESESVRSRHMVKKKSSDTYLEICRVAGWFFEHWRKKNHL